MAVHAKTRSMDIHGYPWISVGPVLVGLVPGGGLTPPQADAPTAAAVVVTYVINFSIGYPGHGDIQDDQRFDRADRLENQEHDRESQISPRCIGTHR